MEKVVLIWFALAAAVNVAVLGFCIAGIIGGAIRCFLRTEKEKLWEKKNS